MDDTHTQRSDGGPEWSAPSIPLPPRPDERIAGDGGLPAPEAPTSLDGAGVAPEVLFNLALKFANATAQFDMTAVAQHLRLPTSLVATLLERLRAEKLIEVLGGSAGPLSYRYCITQLGRDRAAWLTAICGYVGPAPVSLQAYTTFLERQMASLPAVSLADVTSALSDLELPEPVVELAGLAVSSGRSLFLHGPPGNGKTTLGRLLHRALRGTLWIPYCLGVEDQIIRVFDRHTHAEVDGAAPADVRQRHDQRWVRIQRPFVVVGGELTLNDLDLIYDASRRYYEAPLHMKANGGIFLLDDFGCQKTPPAALLNRWIIPLEQGLDFLTLATGQQIMVPFRNMLVVSTNLDPRHVTTPGLLRRMGYRVSLDDPTPERYARIFSRYAAQRGLEVPPGLVDAVLDRYRAEHRPMRACEPRDLIERVRDICAYRGRPDALGPELLDVAWTGYFGAGSQEPPGETEPPPA